MTHLQSEVTALHRRARTSEAFSVLDRSTISEDAVSLLLRARLSIDASPSVAMTTLDDSRVTDGSPRHQAEAAVLRGRAHTKLGEYDAAANCLAVARAFLGDCGLADDALFFELEVALGTLMLVQSRLDEAESIASAIVDTAKLTAHAAAPFVLLSQVAWQREQHDRNAGYLLQALGVISLDADPDVRLWASTLRRLAYVHQFVSSPAVREALAHHVTALPWTDDLADLRSRVYQLLGTRAILDGDMADGSALFKRACTLANVSLPTRIIAIISRAQLSRWLGEPRAFEDHLLDATALAQQLDWRTVVKSDRQILLQLAEMHASRDSALAHSFVGHFYAIGRFGFEDSHIIGSPSTLQDYCVGLLYVKTGEREKGTRMIEAAFIEYRRLRFDWVAGEAAIILAEITQSIVWRSHARELLAKYPASYLTSRLMNLEHLHGDAARRASIPVAGIPRVTLLTPTQRIVYYRLLEGAPVKVIAADLRRSDLTVRNHVQAIFRKFGVNSRADLISSRC